MKYRGLCKLLTRRPGRLNYAAKMDIPIEKVGSIWWEQHEKKARRQKGPS